MRAGGANRRLAREKICCALGGDEVWSVSQMPSEPPPSRHRHRPLSRLRGLDSHTLAAFSSLESQAALGMRGRRPA